MNLDLNLLMDLIKNVGFPIVIALYTLIRLERTVQRNTDAINNLQCALIENRKPL